jgi:hypothetical protein
MSAHTPGPWVVAGESGDYFPTLADYSPIPATEENARHRPRYGGSMTPDTIARMLQYGGSFAQAMADAWMCADPVNRAKLEDTFSELFNKYKKG